MASTSPPQSPGPVFHRPLSAMVRPAPRSSSRMSVSSKAGGGSRASDEDGKTSVKVGEFVPIPFQSANVKWDAITVCPSSHQENQPSSSNAPQKNKLTCPSLLSLCSRSRPTLLKAYRSWLRPHSPAFSKAHGPSHVKYNSRHRCTPGPESFCL